MPATLFVPPYLQSLGYASAPELQALAQRAVTIREDSIAHDPLWGRWRGVLEYVSCAEHARHSIRALPTGRAIGSVDVVPAQYHSASLVFFAQATLDNIAVWTADSLKLTVKGSDCAFHKAKFIQALRESSPALVAAFQPHDSFIQKLEAYRQEWIHRLSGGARIFSDKNPSDPTAVVQIMVPINPATPFGSDPKAFLRSVGRTRTNNGGRWLYPVAEFADEMADALRAFLYSFIASALAEPKLTSPPKSG